MNNVYFRFIDKIPYSKEFYPYENYFILEYSQLEEHEMWSTYKLQIGIIQTIMRDFKHLISKNDYVLCPIYADENDKDFFKDIRFGITETSKENEDIFDCFKRGIGEELGFRYLKDKPPENCLEIFFKKNKYYIYPININDTKSIAPIEKQVPNNIIKDDKTLPRSGCIIYGDEAHILNYLNRDNILLDMSNDDIVGLAAIKFLDAKTHFL
jgi:hypothetical protein